MPNIFRVYVDSDHAGCKRTRKSTNGGCVLHGRHLVKSWSSTQAVVALSVAESEYYSLIKGGCEGIGLTSAATDWGEDRDVDMWTDSSAARGIASRMGLNKRTRHIAVHHLWLQERLELSTDAQKVLE